MAINHQWALARVKWVFGIPVVTTLLLLGMCEVTDPTYAYHYRLTLEVELPDGAVRSGSSVVQVKIGATKGCDFGHRFQRVSGEAAVVKLGDDRVLVALLPNWYFNPIGWPADGPTQVLARAYNIQLEWRANSNPGLGRLERQRGSREIGPNDLPLLVTFADSANPKTVARVDPRDLEASFGSGVRLRRATIEVTSDRVTGRVIERALPWLRGMETNLKGERYTSANDLPSVLIPLVFRRKNL